MHIPNGLLDPKMSAGLSFASAGALSYCLNKVRELVASSVVSEALAGAGNTVSTITGKARRVLSSAGTALIMKMMMVGSLIFAVQLFDFPVLNGTTGHLLGCAFAAISLGPWAGGIVMAAVLTIQCLFMGDGGTLALGANIFNMAIIGTMGAYFIYRLSSRAIKGKPGYYTGVALASWISVVAAAAATAFEVGLSGTFKPSWTFNSMVSVHSIIGIAEALATIGILGLLGTSFDRNKS